MRKAVSFDESAASLGIGRLASDDEDPAQDEAVREKWVVLWPPA